jgi:hypothetical protein
MDKRIISNKIGKTTEQEEKRKIEKYGECFYEKGKSKEGIGNKNRDIGKK